MLPERDLQLERSYWPGAKKACSRLDSSNLVPILAGLDDVGDGHRANDDDEFNITARSEALTLFPPLA